jgi:A/G-specific adenine glycosylase
MATASENSNAPESTERIRRKLLAWYRANRRNLPWRGMTDPYRIWLSEVMLQQTRVETVRPYFRRFLKTFPTISDLAAADPERVLKMWEGLGYYARARNFHAAARRVATECGGRVPDRMADFRKLPGVGEYIGAAVMSIAFGQAHAAVDGNAKRVLARLFRVEPPVNSSSAGTVFRELAQSLLDPEDPGDWNQAVMELGATICAPRNPACPECPLSGDCRAFRDGAAEAYPRREKKKPIPLRVESAGVLWREERIFVVRRPPRGLLGGLWEIPAVPPARNDTPHAALSRRYRDEFGIGPILISKYPGTIRHAYTHFRLELHAFRCIYTGEAPLPEDAETIRWIDPRDPGDLPFHGAALKMLALLGKFVGG